MSRGAAEDILVHAYQCVAKVGGQRENKVVPGLRRRPCDFLSFMFPLDSGFLHRCD